MRVAAIDCGTNSIRLLIADAAEATPEEEAATPVLTEVLRRTEVVRLGQGVDRTGRLDPEALERTLGMCREYAQQCREHGVREETADRALSRISGKQNCFAAVVFDKWQSDLEAQAPHVVLHHPMDEGNLGTIERTLLGLGILDLAVIRPAADPFDPRVVRATMGAIFSLRVKQYDSFEAYRAEHPSHALYPFMLDGSKLLDEACRDVRTPYALVFGNEGSGLPPEFAGLGQAVRIPHSDRIDSLNLSVAVAIGAYAFTRPHVGLNCDERKELIG